MLKYWVEFFDDLVQIRGRSKNTVMAYRRDLELYQDYVEAIDKGIGEFYLYMQDKGLSPRSQARVISSLRTYYRFCEKQGEEAPELRELKPPKVKVGLPKAVNIDDFRRLYDACDVDNPFKTARNQICLLLLFGLGCRVSELIGLDLKDYQRIDQWLLVKGKGNKERIIPLTENLSQELNDYLEKVRPELVRGEDIHSVLVNDRGRRPSRVDIWRWLSAWSQKAGFDETVNPHRFRHGCATALLEAGADLRSIQMLLGHASLQTTQVYTSVTSKKKRQVIDEHHPLSRPDSGQ